jgi:hypothetical protein
MEQAMTPMMQCMIKPAMKQAKERTASGVDDEREEMAWGTYLGRM